MQIADHKAWQLINESSKYITNYFLHAYFESVVFQHNYCLIGSCIDSLNLNVFCTFPKSFVEQTYLSQIHPLCINYKTVVFQSAA